MNKTKHLKRTRLLKKTKKYFGGKNTDNTKSKENTDEPKENTDEPKENTDEPKENTDEPKEKTEETTKDTEETKETEENTDSDSEDKPEGVFDIIGDKATDFAKDTGSFVADKTLRLLGLQRINENSDQQDNKLAVAASGLASNVESIGNDVVKVFDKGSAAIIGNINDVLESPKIEKSVTEAAEETVKSGTKLLNIFNKNLNNPEFKEQTKVALDNIADYANITVQALNDPLDKAIDEFSEAGNKAAAGVAAGIIKVGTDAMGAIPGYGAIIDVGKMINDSTRAASSVVESASDAAETASELFLKTTKGIEKGMKELQEKKNEAMNIANRTSNSINQFQNPSLELSKNLKKSSDKITKAIPSVGGSRKSKKRLLKRKAKSKKVRFAV